MSFLIWTFRIGLAFIQFNKHKIKNGVAWCVKMFVVTFIIYMMITHGRGIEWLER